MKALFLLFAAALAGCGSEDASYVPYAKSAPSSDEWVMPEVNINPPPVQQNVVESNESDESEGTYVAPPTSTYTAPSTYVSPTYSHSSPTYSNPAPTPDYSSENNRNLYDYQRQKSEDTRKLYDYQRNQTFVNHPRN
jgi:hypothetical protein